MTQFLDVEYCLEDGCYEAAAKYGFCQPHCAARQPTFPCSVEWCNEPVLCRGWCKYHYDVARNHDGDPLGSRVQIPLPIGDRTIRRDGYAFIQTANGREPEHRLVMAEMIKRDLAPGENVHHKNGIRDDNSPSNLELWVIPQPAGQRVIDLVEWVVREYPTEVAEMLSQAATIAP